MMIRIVKLTIDPGSIEQFMDYFNRVSGDIRSFSGCSRLELLADLNTPGVLFTYSYWEDEEALRLYQQSDLFKSTWALVKPLFAAKAEAWSMVRIKEIELI
jgi:quinol monooxygenase YgiN